MYGMQCEKRCYFTIQRYIPRNPTIFYTTHGNDWQVKAGKVFNTIRIAIIKLINLQIAVFQETNKMNLLKHIYAKYSFAKNELFKMYKANYELKRDNMRLYALIKVCIIMY